MVRQIVRDIFLLRQKSTDACKDDLHIADDLLDTLKANRAICVGMAANMIGFRKKIIAFCSDKGYEVMINPTIVSRCGGEYEAEEGCLSLVGVRKVIRWKTIEVEFSDKKFRRQKKRYTGDSAQIIQHEIDHFEGRLI